MTESGCQEAAGIRPSVSPVENSAAQQHDGAANKGLTAGRREADTTI